MGYDYAVMDKLVKNFEHWSPRGTCLFPQLRSLSYTTTGGGSEDFPYDTHIPVFLLSIAGPQLVKLDIHLSCNRANVNTSANAPEGFLPMPVALDQFCKNYPNLESCSFWSTPYHMPNFDTSPISEALDGAITRLPRLSYFKAFNPLSTSWTSAIRNCLSSSRLKRLRLVLCPSTMNALDNEHRVTFSALDDLAIWGSDSGTLARFFDIIDAPRLDRVFVDIQSSGAELATEHLMEGLARCPEITKLDFRIDNDSDTEVVFHVSSLAPLFKLTTIVNLELRGPERITSTVGDLAIDQMARSWPHMQQLTLDFPKSDEVRPCVSAVSLLSLAQHCPQFQQLAVSMDATITPTEQILSAASLIPKPAFCLKRSLQLHEFTTSARNPKALARILDSLGFEPIPPEGSRPDGWTEVMWEMGKLCGTIATTSPYRGERVRFTSAGPVIEPLVLPEAEEAYVSDCQPW